MALNKVGIGQAVRDMFRADTSVLYGTGKLVQTIESGITTFPKAHVSVANKPYGLYLFCSEDIEPEKWLSGASYNQDYIVEMIIHTSKGVKVEAAEIQADLIMERTKVLFQNQFAQGKFLDDYYTDSYKQICNIDFENSTIDEAINTNGGPMSIKLNNRIRIKVNTVRQ